MAEECETKQRSETKQRRAFRATSDSREKQEAKQPSHAPEIPVPSLARVPAPPPSHSEAFDPPPTETPTNIYIFTTTPPRAETPLPQPLPLSREVAAHFIPHAVVQRSRGGVGGVGAEKDHVFFVRQKRVVPHEGQAPRADWQFHLWIEDEGSEVGFGFRFGFRFGFDFGSGFGSVRLKQVEPSEHERSTDVLRFEIALSARVSSAGRDVIKLTVSIPHTHTKIEREREGVKQQGPIVCISMCFL